MIWNNDEPSYFEDSSQTLYICMHCMLACNDFNANTSYNVKNIIIGSQEETEFNISKDEDKDDNIHIPSINELALYDPTETPRIYRTTEASFNIAISKNEESSYIYQKNHDHDILLKKLKNE